MPPKIENKEIFFLRNFFLKTYKFKKKKKFEIFPNKKITN